MSDAKIYGVVLAGGIGSRMGNQDKPKQYLLVGDKPILIHTMEKFYIESDFEKVIVLCPKEWIAHTKNLVRKYLKNEDGRVVVIPGGETRNETIMNAIDYIDSEGNLNEDTIIVTHDSVRPFVTQRIIEENIRYAKEVGACDTAMPATDTIVISEDNESISEIPERKRMYQGQTPQTFQALKLKRLYESLTEEEKSILTDAAKIFVMKGERVHIVEGEVFNIKITYPYDLRVAEALIQGNIE
ncbi:MAG: 2-C-methyl-D-erythritol 4-phosphate cytidylyltransferase [Eubacterium sp.]|nr:2-C-methyl-D-erythritol 4-phosphate cytidylyltransferase [Eubacterium sp.]